MMTKKMLEEMRRDGLSKKRRKALSGAPDDHLRMTLEEYIKFLDEIQRIWGPFPVTREKWVEKPGMMKL